MSPSCSSLGANSINFTPQPSALNFFATMAPTFLTFACSGWEPPRKFVRQEYHPSQFAWMA